MAKNKPANERTRRLRTLRRRRFERFRFVGWDALVARVPEGGPLPPAVRAMVAEGSPMRVYPVPGGYLYKWPRYDRVEPPEGFEVETGGWDHEHCDACDRSVDRGGTAWLTVRGSWFQLCPYCYRQIRRLECLTIASVCRK